jgi:hypothetical protein
MADIAAMIAEPSEIETCAACRTLIGREHIFCRIYQEEVRHPFCSPRCAHNFLWRSRAGAASAPGDDLIAEIVTEWRWRELGA